MTDDLYRSYAEKATAVRRDYLGAQKIIRGDHSLSDAGKTIALSNLYLTTNTELTEMAAAHKAAVATRRRELERRAFAPPAGTGVDAVARQASYRDALSRVEQIDRSDQASASKLLERAERTGDDLLAQAVAAIAVERGWNDTLASYTEKRPTESDALNELMSLQRRESDLEWKMLRGTFSGAQKPAEVSKMSDDQIAVVAATPAQAARTAPATMVVAGAVRS